MNSISSMMDGPLGILIGLFFIIWTVLMFFSPFFWYGTNKRTREISQKMDELIAIARTSTAK